MAVKNKFWRALFISFPVLIFIIAFRQDADQKFWNEQSPLTWEDFKQPKRTEDYGGQSGSNTLVGEIYRYRRLGSDSSSYVFEFKVASVMIKSHSYVDPAYKTAALLAHEQLHFDISEYFARQLLLAFQKATYTKNYKNEIKDIRHNYSVQRDSMEKLYDKQTNHSRNTDMQAKWNEYVKSLLINNESIEVALKKLPKF